MNYKNIIAAILITGIPLSGFAEHDSYGYKRHQQKFYDYARVRSVTPIVKTIERRIPHKSCRNERVRYSRASSNTPIILGGIIGAAIGNQVGHHKSNKRVGVIAGSILGAAIGNDIRNNSSYQYSDYGTERRCHKKYDIQLEEQVVGYNVKYRYHGETYFTQTQEHPGKKIRLKIRFEPVQR